MNSDNNSFSLGKYLLVVVGVSIVGALACVGAQLLIAGETSPAITGGVAGAVAVTATAQLRRRRRGGDGK